MSALTVYGRQFALASLLTPDIRNTLSDVWIALTTVVPTVSGTGSDLIEPADIAYGRVLYSAGSSHWDFTGSGAAYNTQPLVFPNPTVGGDWGLMRGWAMCTASTAGQVVLVGALTVPVRVYYSGALAQLTVPVGGIQINHY